MEPAAQNQSNSLARYVASVRAAWGDGKDPELPFRIKPLLENLLRQTSADERWLARLIAEGKQAEELYRDPDYGFIQMGHNQPAGHRNAPHDHGPCWVLYGVYRGKIEITTYRRADGGAGAGQAAIEKKDLHALTPGVVYAYLPGDIHSTFAPEPAVVFRFLSYDLNKVDRYRYDIEKGTVSLVRPAAS
ncbi:MAG TPA: hypothetical protein VNL14_03660 [Candidatus Acidoferrales bacterium]|nr:hypothetical protein [Candidatus Acidoferrales bacterium]